MAKKSIHVKVGETWYTAEIEDVSSSPVKVHVEGETFYVDVEGVRHSNPAHHDSALSTTRVPLPELAQRAGAGAGAPISDKIIRSPMPGKVVAVTVKPGDTVSRGQEVCVVEAMKMEQSIRASHEGLIKAVHVQPMQQVGTDDPIIELE